jgi:uncharacterized protein YabE (DUF348 family)
MKRLFWLLLDLALAACQPQNVTTSFILLDGGRVIRLQSASSTPAAVLAEAGIALAPVDRLLFRGADFPVDFAMPPGGTYTLQIRRAHMLTLVTPDGEKSLQSAAFTLGQALAENGGTFSATDYVTPPLETPLEADLTVTYRPAREFTVRVNEQTVTIQSSARTVGQALAEGGIPLLGLDQSRPGEFEPVPADGQIKIIRVSETVSLEQKPLPFSKKYEYSSDLGAGEQKVLQAGEPGLKVSRVRVRYADGVEVARTTEAETVVRLPKDSLVRLGTQVTVQTLAVPGGQIQYWRVVQMYATSYSPCRSGTSKCSYGTASGLPVKHGVVAMTRDLYNALAGTQVYIPGYGLGVIGDVGGGFPDGRLWIDLGYSDEDWQNWGGMVTVYFLAPAPAAIPNSLQYSP